MEKYKLIPYRIAYIIVCNIMGKQFEDCSVVSIYFQYMKGVQNAHPLAHLLKTTLYSCSLYLLMLKLALQIIKGFTETLEVNHFTLTQKFNYVIHIGIVRQAQNIVVCRACFLLCCNHERTT